MRHVDGRLGDRWRALPACTHSAAPAAARVPFDATRVIYCPDCGMEYAREDEGAISRPHFRRDGDFVAISYPAANAFALRGFFAWCDAREGVYAPHRR